MKNLLNKPRPKKVEDFIDKIHALVNGYAKERMPVVMDEVNAVIMTDKEINSKDVEKILGREIAIAFLKGYRRGEDDTKPRIIT